MICPTCNNYNADNTQFCTRCGSAMQKTASRDNTNNHVIAVWLYAGYLIFSSIVYRVFNRLIIPALIEDHNMANVSSMYKGIGAVMLVVELIILGVILGIIKNTSARVAVAVVGAFTLLMFVFDSISNMM